jgi:hypothetical protein
MERTKKFGFPSFTALFLAAAYLFMNLSYLFFLSGTLAGSGITHAPHFRGKAASTSTIQRIDKTVLTENKPVSTIKNALVLVFAKATALSFKPVTANHFAGFLPDKHHLYLSNRIIRI